MNVSSWRPDHFVWWQVQSCQWRRVGLSWIQNRSRYVARWWKHQGFSQYWIRMRVCPKLYAISKVYFKQTVDCVLYLVKRRWWGELVSTSLDLGQGKLFVVRLSVMELLGLLKGSLLWEGARRKIIKSDGYCWLVDGVLGSRDNEWPIYGDIWWCSCRVRLLENLPLIMCFLHPIFWHLNFCISYMVPYNLKQSKLNFPSHQQHTHVYCSPFFLLVTVLHHIR